MSNPLLSCCEWVPMDYSAAPHISPPNMLCFVLISFIVCKVENWKNVEGNLLKLGKKKTFLYVRFTRFSYVGWKKKHHMKFRSFRFRTLMGMDTRKAVH